MSPVDEEAKNARRAELIAEIAERSEEIMRLDGGGGWANGLWPPEAERGLVMAAFVTDSPAAGEALLGALLRAVHEESRRGRTFFELEVTDIRGEPVEPNEEGFGEPPDCIPDAKGSKKRLH